MAAAGENSGNRATAAWAAGGVIAALIIGGCGALAGLFSLQIHWDLSHRLWRSPRYSMYRGGWGWQIFDAGLAMMVASILVSRTTWLLVGLLARLRGRELRWSNLARWDFWTLVLPGTVWLYLIYVANVKNASFWPSALVLVAAYFLLSLRRTPGSKGSSSR